MGDKNMKKCWIRPSLIGDFYRISFKSECPDEPHTLFVKESLNKQQKHHVL